MAVWLLQYGSVTRQQVIRLFHSPFCQELRRIQTSVALRYSVGSMACYYSSYSSQSTPPSKERENNGIIWRLKTRHERSQMTPKYALVETPNFGTLSENGRDFPSRNLPNIEDPSCLLKKRLFSVYCRCPHYYDQNSLCFFLLISSVRIISNKIYFTIYYFWLTLFNRLNPWMN